MYTGLYRLFKRFSRINLIIIFPVTLEPSCHVNATLLRDVLLLEGSKSNQSKRRVRGSEKIVTVKGLEEPEGGSVNSSEATGVVPSSVLSSLCLQRSLY